MVDLIGPDVVDDVRELLHVREISVVQEQMSPRLMRILIDMVNPTRVECACAPNEPMDLVPFVKKQLGKIGTILARYASYHCLWTHLPSSTWSIEQFPRRIRQPAPFALRPAGTCPCPA
jgi:hypothetical protein